MKNEWYESLRKRLTSVFVLLMICVTILVFIMIYAYSEWAGKMLTQGVLQPSDFAYFYLSHSWEMNTLLYCIVYIFVLVFFVQCFFQAMNALTSALKNEPLKKEPLFFKWFHEFKDAYHKIQTIHVKKEQSQQRMQAQRAQKNELLMYLAHDIKTPLTSLIGYLNYILDHPLSNEEEQKAFQIVDEKSLRLNELLDEFSTILRYDEKISELNYDYFGLEIMFQQQLEGFFPLLQQKQLGFHHEIEKDLIIYCDYDKMQRVLENLMRNALNYAIKNSDIHFKAWSNEHSLYMEFANQCEGINEENIQHLFDEFYRSSQARVSKSGGAGLGLAIAKEIIELHKGKIEAYLEGKTIHFRMELPMEVDHETIS